MTNLSQDANILLRYLQDQSEQQEELFRDRCNELFGKRQTRLIMEQQMTLTQDDLAEVTLQEVNDLAKGAEAAFRSAQEYVNELANPEYPISTEQLEVARYRLRATGVRAKEAWKMCAAKLAMSLREYGLLEVEIDGMGFW